jgi:hypothetical protein
MKKHSSILASFLALAFTVTAAWAAAPPKVDVAVTPQTSTPGGVIPDIGGMGNAAVSTYLYQITTGNSITDALPIRLCTTSNPNTAGATGYPLTLHFGPEGLGGNLPGVTLPADVTFTADGCQTAFINLNTGALADGNYNQNISIQDSSATPSNTQVGFDHPIIHIKVKVSSSSATSCFTTDSDFNFLLDCAGNPVTSGSAGTFTIVTNKKSIEVATNPGQFYYNLLYTNGSGADQTVTVTFTRNGVNPNGTQAIHAMVFPAFPVLSATNFDAVNSAIPSGADDKLESVTVPSGWTLWVDYHLEWAGLGVLAPAGIATSCSTANQNFSVTGTVTLVSDGTLLGTCTAGGTGYKK